MLYNMHMEVKRVETAYARQNLATLLDAVIGGHSFIITRHGRDVAQLVPTETRAHEMLKTTGQGKLLERIKHGSDVREDVTWGEGRFRGSELD